ncbi:MAG TPA: VTT domain-containing protein [Allosphingosinicella sp.]
MTSRNLGRLAFLVVVLGAMAAVYVSPLGEWLTLDRLKASRDALAALIEARPLLWTGGFFLLCLVASALCFPAAPILGLAAGALFGFVPGLVTLSLSFSIGSTIACLGSRYWLRDWVKAKLGKRLDPIDRGFERHGAAFLLALRINPLIPYWLVNLAMGVTAMRLRIYFPLTAIGLLPALTIYANAGSRLAAVESMGDVFSPGLLLSLLALSLLPLGADWLRSRFAPAGASGAETDA